ncbi:hypothetical protein PAMA_006197 [Pampus argenteus]
MDQVTELDQNLLNMVKEEGVLVGYLEVERDEVAMVQLDLKLQSTGYLVELHLGQEEGPALQELEEDLELQEAHRLQLQKVVQDFPLEVLVVISHLGHYLQSNLSNPQSPEVTHQVKEMEKEVLMEKEVEQERQVVWLEEQEEALEQLEVVLEQLEEVQEELGEVQEELEEVQEELGEVKEELEEVQEELAESLNLEKAMALEVLEFYQAGHMGLLEQEAKQGLGLAVMELDQEVMVQDLEVTGLAQVATVLGLGGMGLDL